MWPPPGEVELCLNVNRGPGFVLAAQTGTIAAALAQDSVVFAMRADTTAGSVNGVFIDRMRLAFTTIVAFTTPITAARRIGIYRATNAGAEVSGGTDVTASIRKKDSAGGSSTVAKAFIATTGALTAGGLAREASPLAQLDLVNVGTAGARAEFIYELGGGGYPQEWCINPAEYLVVSNPVAMDAAGTFQLSIGELSWYEQRRLALDL